MKNLRLNDDLPAFEPITKHKWSTREQMARHDQERKIRMRYRNCARKLQFTKTQVTQRVAEAANNGKVLRAYKCPNCRLFHLTSQV